MNRPMPDAVKMRMVGRVQKMDVAASKKINGT